MRAPLIAVVLSGVGGAVCAQPANEGPTRLESCFQSARGAGLICSDPAYNPAQRLNCLQRARTTLLECLEHVPQEASPGHPPSEKTAGTAASEMSSGTALPEFPTATVSPDKPAAAIPPDKPTAAADKPAVAVAPDTAPRAVEASPKPPPSWVISETTSPVDYTPLIAAAIRLPFSVKHAPNTLAMRCRGRRTEFLVRTEGTWRVSRAGEVQVEYQIDDQPLVTSPWTASADGKTAIYKDDAVALLQSLAESARLKINVVDGPGPSHEATFQLAGLDAVRAKIAAACKWPPPANKMSLEKR